MHPQAQAQLMAAAAAAAAQASGCIRPLSTASTSSGNPLVTLPDVTATAASGSYNPLMVLQYLASTGQASPLQLQQLAALHQAGPAAAAWHSAAAAAAAASAAGAPPQHALFAAGLTAAARLAAAHQQSTGSGGGGSQGGSLPPPLPLDLSAAQPTVALSTLAKVVLRPELAFTKNDSSPPCRYLDFSLFCQACD